MYYRMLETSSARKQAQDVALKLNANERLAANAAWCKRNKGTGSSSRAIIVGQT